MRIALWIAGGLVGLWILGHVIQLLYVGLFRNRVRRNPGLALRFFLSRPEWDVERGHFAERRPGCRGPFHLLLGNTVFTLYGTGSFQAIRESQGEFFGFVSVYNRNVQQGVWQPLGTDLESIVAWARKEDPEGADRLFGCEDPARDEVESAELTTV